MKPDGEFDNTKTEQFIDTKTFLKNNRFHLTLAAVCILMSLKSVRADGDPAKIEYPIYANIDRVGSYFNAGANTEIGDDMQATGGGIVTAFAFGYYGGDVATTPTNATVRFYSSTPPNGLLAQYPISNLEREPFFFKMKYYELPTPIVASSSFWMTVEFTDHDTGVLLAEATPEIGVSQNLFYLEGSGIVQFQGGNPYANFLFTVYKKVPRPAGLSFLDWTNATLGTSADQGASMAVVDFDQDGWDDLCFGTDRMFRNDGAGGMLPVTIPGLSGAGATRCAWADYDNDGDLDVMTTGGSSLERLFRNDSGTFTEVSSELVGSTHPEDDMQCLAWGDYNNDGFLDCYAANFGNAFVTGHGRPDRLWRNDGDDAFTDVGSSVIPDATDVGRGTAWSDFDNDGDADIYVSNYWVYKNYLFQNDSGVLSNVAVSLGVEGEWSPFYNGSDPLLESRGHAQHSAGSSWGDYDNDGDMDLLEPTIHSLVYLYRNDGAAFSDRTAAAGLPGQNEWAGASFVDVNNDGWLDIYAHQWYKGQMARLYLSNGPVGPGGEVTFTHATLDVGLWRIDSGDSASNTWADFDNDGDMDLVTRWTPTSNAYQVRYMRNELNSGHHWLHVQLAGVASNATGIGASVTVSAGGITQTRQIFPQSQTGTGFSHRAHFGLGSIGVVDTLTVSWPSGAVSILRDVTVDQVVVVEEPFDVPGDINGDSILDESDIDTFVAVLLGYDSFSDHVMASDLNQDGSANGLDLQQFITVFLDD